MTRQPVWKWLAGTAGFLVLMHASVYIKSTAADTCVDCHTNVEILKKLAPPVLETAKPLSEGEG